MVMVRAAKVLYCSLAVGCTGCCYRCSMVRYFATGRNPAEYIAACCAVLQMLSYGMFVLLLCCAVVLCYSVMLLCSCKSCVLYCAFFYCVD